MKSAKFFIDRPIFATVVSILVVIVGLISLISLPVEEFPEVAPPTIQVVAAYPGADAQTVADTVATPIEQEVNGVQGMLYMQSQATADGQMTLTITFETGTDLDIAQVLVQNRVSLAEPRLPAEVRRIGITTRKNSPNLMMVINLVSPNNTYDTDYLANYSVLNIRDELQRIEGVGSMALFGGSDYAMRIWLDPNKLKALDLIAGDVIGALRSQNVQVASGVVNQSPQPQQRFYEYSIRTQGRLVDPDAFENIIVKSSSDGRIVTLGDVARVELGAQSYVTKGYLSELSAIAVPIFQRPGTNALDTSQTIIDTMDRLALDFPPDLEYKIVYNTTDFIADSIDAVVITFYEALLLVVLVIVLFLQSARASLIPVVAIPISIIGTFAVLFALNFSINNLTLLAVILAIGIVVDDAIVVVENMERNIRDGLGLKESARKTMDEVGSALVAMGLVLTAVFLPTLFLDGISGAFYQQFGVVIAVSTIISVACSLILSPALSAIVLMPFNPKPSDQHETSVFKKPFTLFFDGFNKALNKVNSAYQKVLRLFIKMKYLMLVIYAGIMALTVYLFTLVPGGFIPSQDKGYLIVAIQLPPGASLSATDEVARKAIDIILQTDGVDDVVGFTGIAGGTFTTASNAAVLFPTLSESDIRAQSGQDYNAIAQNLYGALSQIEEAFIVVIPPPSVSGLGNSGGFQMMLKDTGGRGLAVLEQSAWMLAGAANQTPEVNSVFTFFENSTPQFFLDIDRVRAQKLNVSIDAIFESLEVYIGSSYVNDFNYLGRTYRVTAQADAQFRLSIDDVLAIEVRSTNGVMVPLSTLAKANFIAGPNRLPRYNLAESAGLLGNNSVGYSSGEAIATMERLADEILPNGISYEWTEIAYQEKQTSNTASVAFALAVLFVFLLLAAQFESWLMPLSVVLIVPMCLFSAMSGLWLTGLDNNILAQVGFVILVGLASKNAILIVEFARELESQGRNTIDAAVESAKLRLRPILMTSFAFILGVSPMVFASGPGAEMRQSLGITVFSGMLGVTLFGLLFTPVFYVLCRGFAANKKGASHD